MSRLRKPALAMADKKLAINGGSRSIEHPQRARDIPEQAISRVSEVLRRGEGFQWYGGEATREFEDGFRGLLGTRHAILCSSGTAALHAVFSCLGVTSGSVVAVPSFAFYSCITTIMQVGAQPMFVPVDERTMVVDVRAVVDELPPNSMFLAVHSLGRAVDVGWLRAQRPDVTIVEDAAEAQCVTFGGHQVGTVGVAACWSLTSNQNEIHGAGVAGVITTDDDDLASRLRAAIHYGKPGPGKSDLDINPPAMMLGFNYQSTEVEAAVAAAMLKDATTAWNSRKEAGARLAKELRELGLDVLDCPAGCDQNYYDVVFRLPADWATSRDWLLAALLAEGCEGAWTYYSLMGLPWVIDHLRAQGWWTSREERLRQEQVAAANTIVGIRPVTVMDDCSRIRSAVQKVMCG